MTKRILLMYKAWAGYLLRFVEEGKKQGVEVTLGHFTELTLATSNKQQVTSNNKGYVTVEVAGRDVAEFDLVYVRSVGDYHEEMTILAEYCKIHGVKFLERTLVEGNVDRDHKSFEALKLLEAGLGYPKSFFGSAAQTLEYLRQNTIWPVVIKDTEGRRGRGAYLVRDLATVEKIYLGRSRRNYVVQEYIENDGEYRVWVVGGKLIGAMHRPVRVGGFELVGMMGSSKKITLDKDMEMLAIQAAEALQIDVAGIDMVLQSRTHIPYVLEVNRAGSFDTFERVTGVDVVAKIVGWLVVQIQA